MATIKTIIEVSGDATKAVNAFSKILEKVNLLDKVMKNLNASTSRVASQTQAETTKMTSYWQRLIASAAKYASTVRAATPSTGPPVPLQQKITQSPVFETILQGARNLSDWADGWRTKVASVFTSGPIIGFGNAVTSLGKTFLNLNDVIRFTAQGITNMGRSLFFFVSIPIIGFLKGVIGGAIDFENALVRVQKTSGLTTDQMLDLREAIRGIAINSATSHVEIAKLAEIIGQAGVKSWTSIANLTNTFEMMTVSMDMGSEEIAKSMTRIANAFGWNLNQSTEEVTRLANVFNRLENDTAANAGEIITATTKFAQAASTLKITAANAAGLSASLIAMGVTQAEAGTGLKNLSYYLIKNAEDVANAMQANEKYNTSAKVIAAINEDAVQSFLDIASAAANSGDNALALGKLMELASQRGGRAIVAMMSNLDLLRQNLAIANDEWEKANSLAIEYNRALLSTKNQLQVLKNNINDVGVTIGDALLPVINEFVQVAVPALRMVSDWFKKLEPGIQQQIIGWTAFLLVLGPLLMFFGQMLHAITLINMSFGALLKNLGAMIVFFGRIINIVKLVATSFLMWPVAIVGAIFLVLKVLQKLGVDVAGFFSNLANRMKAWGENLAATLASGLMAGAVRFITKVLTAIANLIAGFFRGHSPPKVGPLSSIDKWGSKVLQAYLNGFKNADFSILKDVGGMIEKMLTRGLDDKAMPKALAQAAKARVKIAKVIETFNKTGIISRKALDEAVSGLGHMKDEVKNLVITWLEYNKLQERIQELEARRKGVLKTYQEELKLIGASNRSVKDKVAAIRAAQRSRDDELRTIDNESEALEEQRAQMEATLEFQKNMLDAMNEQDDLLQRLIDAVERLKEALSSAAGGGGLIEDFELGEIDTGQIEEVFSNLGEEFETLQERLDMGRMKLQGFFDALAGNPRQIFDNEEIQATYDKLYEIGTVVATIRDKALLVKDAFLGFLDSIQNRQGLFDSLSEEGRASFDRIIEKGQEMYDRVVEFVSGIASWFVTNWNTIVAYALTAWAVITGIFAGIGTALSPAFETVKRIAGEIWEQIKGTFEQIGEIFAPLFSSIADNIGPILTLIGAIALAIFGLIVAVLGGILQFAASVIQGIVSIISGVITVISGIIGVIVNSIGAIISLFTGNFDRLKEYTQGLQDSLKAIFGGMWTIILGIFQGTLQAILGFVVGFVNGIVGFIQGMYDKLVGNSIIPDMLNKAKEFFTSILGQIIETISTWVNDTIAKFQEMADTVIERITEFIELVKDKFTLMLERIKETVQKIKDTFTNTDWKQVGKGIIDGIKNAITNGIGSLIEAAKKAAKAALDAFMEMLGIDSPSKEFYLAGQYSVEGFILPFEKIDKMLAQSFAGIDALSIVGSNLSLGQTPTSILGGTQDNRSSVQVVFNNPVVREEQDLQRLADKVGTIWAGKISNGNRFGGVTSF